jgi:tRNA threonylcarbamoyladenosine biosynthesis protein TsaB
MAQREQRQSVMSAPAPRADYQPLLGIDTSSGQGGVALYDGQRLSTRSWPADRSHTTTLLSEIHQLLTRAEVRVRDLAAVAIATGPGSFTGLRVGFGVAKGFHLAAGIPLIGVPTLEATALALASCGTPIVAVVGAGRDRLVWARFEVSTNCLTQVRAPRNGTVGELIDELNGSGPALVTGEIDDHQAELINRIDQVSLPPVALRMRLPGAFAELAWKRWRAGDVDDATAIEPVYLAR